MPTTSIDTFFACTIIIAAALIATASVASTLQTGIASTQDVNKQNYLKAIADHIITNSGGPIDWGSSASVPADFGLAANPSATPYELDIDKVTRLNTNNNYSLTYFEMAKAAKLNNIALGLAVSQIMTIGIVQSSNSTVGNQASFSFTITTGIESKPVSAILQCYAVADNYLVNVTGSTSDVGVGDVTIQIPIASTGNAMLVVFARASFDDRITSYALYNFDDSTQESAPTNNIVTLSPLNCSLSLTANGSGSTVQGGYVFSYGYYDNLPYSQSTARCPIPNIVDKSPLVIIINGLSNGTYFQEWTSYPQVPLTTGSTFTSNERNIFSYVVTIKGALYRLDISLGDVPP